MRILKLAGLCLLSGIMIQGCSRPSGSGDKEMNRFVDDLMGKMTLEEKLGQMNLVPANGSMLTGPETEMADAGPVANGQVGALLNVMSPKNIFELQQIAVTRSRLGIPLLIGMDVVHGYNTIFPIPLGMSATWNMEAIEQAVRISAVEATAQGVCWAYGPMVDISIDPRWGRVAEGAGEDAFLGSRVAEAYVRGFQGGMTRNDELMCCVKHFALYGAPEGGRDYNSVDMSRMRMFNEYFPPFDAAVKAGAGSFMAAFNDVEGIPAAANRWLLTDVLRDRWGFDGFVVSDWDAVRELTVHGMGDIQQVSARALKAGTDMDMATQGFLRTLKQSLDEGKVSMKDIDQACRRILEAKYKLGLFADPYKYCDTGRIATDVFTPEHRAASRRVAAESFVLLKNKDNILPLARKGTIAVIGPLADSKMDVLGCWTFGADYSTPVTVLEGLKQAVQGQASLLHARGSNLAYGDVMERKTAFASKPYVFDNRPVARMHAEALAAAQKADVILAVMGEGAEMAGEGASRSDIGIPEAQKELLVKLKATGKPVVLVLFAGRPMTLAWEEENLDAILNVWFPGTEAGLAIADVLFGDREPGGRLTMTFPRSVGQIPIRYAYRQTGRPAAADGSIGMYVTGYLDQTVLPLYPFGYGLGYTTFSYGEVRLDKNQITGRESLVASVEVTNTGARGGSEVVQLYIRDLAGAYTRPVKELKGFEKIRLQPGESSTVSFTVTPEMLKFYDNQTDFILEPGDFEVMIGPNSAEVKGCGFTLL